MNAIVRPYRQGEERYVAELHKRLYSEEYSWGPSFTDYAAKIALSAEIKRDGSARFRGAGMPMEYSFITIFLLGRMYCLRICTRMGRTK